MKDYISSIHDTLSSIEKKFGGDVTLISPIKEKDLENFECLNKWKIPHVFRYFYTKETNGIIINNKRIYGIFDRSQKKTWVENLLRMNDPNTSPWFMGRPHIFNDYLVIGNDDGVIFCLSKKYDLPNPSVYICKNPNNKMGIDLNKINLDLESLIIEMVKQAFD